MANEKQIHLAIIPDGNRRWAKKRALQPWLGHQQGVETFRKIIDWSYNDPRIGVLTIWGFSTENWNRSKREIDYLMQIYEKFLRRERHKLMEKKTKLIHSGRSDRIPASLAKLIREITEETSKNDKFVINFALDYGGRDEVMRAMRKIEDVKNVTEESFRRCLDHPELPDIDLVIRTSGEQRTSGFFIWQSAYAELMFSDKLFPDFTSEDLAVACGKFESRQRRFGK